jgi:hypothetical protein
MFATEQIVSVADRRKAATFASQVDSHVIRTYANTWGENCFDRVHSKSSELLESRHIPIISCVDSPPDPKMMRDYACDLLALMCRHISEKFHNLNGLVYGDPADGSIVTLVDLTLRGAGSALAGLCSQRALPIDLTAFFATYLTRPFREKLSQLSAAQRVFDEWPLGYCPVCGLWTRMGHITEVGGQLKIWCIGCDQTWKFPRLRCPFCQERDPANLGYLKIDGSERFRAYTCESCRRYFKTISGPDAEGIDFDTEYLSSSGVDLAAGFEGYIQDFVGYAAFDMQDNAASRTYRRKAMSYTDRIGE